MDLKQRLELFKRRFKKKEFTPLNDYFSYGISGDTAHIHLPVNIKEMIKEKGIDYTLELVNDKMIDALDKLTQVVDESKIKKVFAVSPLLSQKFISDRLRLLGFDLREASAPLKRYFKGVDDLQQASIPLDTLKKVIDIEKETQTGMDKSSPMWHDRILSFKYDKLKELGITGKNDISLDDVIKYGKQSYNYRNGLPITEKKNQKLSPEKLREQDIYPKQNKTNKQDKEFDER